MVFPIEFFPDSLKAVILDTCNAYKYNLDYLCCGVLSAISSASGCVYKLEFKKGWQSKPALFIAIVGVKGTAKTPPLNWSLSPIHKRDSELYREYKEERKEAIKNSRDLPKLSKNIVKDTTIESLISTMNRNKRGILLHADELAGFINSFDRYSKSNYMEMILEIWNDSGAIVVDRKTDEMPVRIENPMLNIIGTIQPNILDSSFKDKDDNGFFDRWLICAPNGVKKEYWSEDEPDEKLRRVYVNGINRLMNNEFAINDFDENASKILRYGDEAKKIIYEWQRANTDESNNTDDQTIKGIRAKMETYIHRFALIHHLTKYAYDTDSLGVDQYLDPDSAKMAIKLASYFTNTAIKLRTSTIEEKLPNDLRNLLEDMPIDVTFTTSNIVERGKFYQINETRIKRFLKNIEGELLRKVAHGKYQRI